MRTTLASSAPLGRLLEVTRCSMMNSALQRMARVMAICAAISIAPTLLRRMAERMGRISIECAPLLSFELPSGLNLSGAPGGVQPGKRGRYHRKGHGDCNVRGTEMRQASHLLREQRTQSHKTQGRERQTE